MIISETSAFLLACLLGAAFGAFYDVFRIIRLVIPHGKVIVFFEDVFYFIVLTFVCFAFVLEQGNGVLRGFIIFGELIGMILYFFTVSLLIMKSAQLIISVVSAIFHFGYCLIIRPFVCIFSYLFKIMRYIFSKSLTFSEKFWRKRKIDLN